MLDAPPSRLRRLDDAVMAFVRFVRDAGALALLIAFGLGSVLWPARNTKRLMDLWYNRLPYELRVEGAIDAAVGAAGVLLGYAIVAFVARRRGGGSLTAIVADLNRRMVWALGLPLVAFVAIEPIEKHYPHLVAVYVAIFAGLVAASVQASRLPTWKLPRVVREVLPPLILLVIAGLFAAHLSDLAITNHQALRTQTADLGYYDNIFYQSSHGNPLGCTFMPHGHHYSGHFDPILVLLSPLYLIYPQAELILALQIIWLTLGVVPAYLLMRHAVRSPWAGLAFGLTYLAYPALHGVAMYEFHSIALLGPLAMGLMFTLQTRSFRAYWVLLPLCLLVREDVPLVMALVGVSILFSMPQHRLHGWLTLALSVVYFGVVKGLIMTSSDLLNCSNGGSCFAYYFEDMIKHKKGMRDIALSVGSNPAFAVSRVLIIKEKLLYLLQLFVPLLGLPLIAPRGRITMLFGLVFTLLASREPVYSIAFQYSTFIYPFAFAITPLALAALLDGRRLPGLTLHRGRLVRGLVLGMLVASTLLSWKFGVVVDNQAFKGGFARIQREPDKRSDKMRAFIFEAMEKVPHEARLAVTRQMGPQVSNRPFVYPYPQVRRFPDAELDYVLMRDQDLDHAERGRLRTAERKKELKQVAARHGIRLYEVLKPGFLERERKRDVEKRASKRRKDAKRKRAEKEREKQRRREAEKRAREKRGPTR
ncbi:MAG: DUF2079 domain-containing protein [Myxococcales bacterium]|nr:DUF2079 domain-containing protein [Myxococcales bacterium]